MNILIFSWRGIGHPKSGGAEIVTHEHAKYWVKSGCKVTIFTSNYAHSTPYEVIDGVKYVRAGNEIMGVQLTALKWYLFQRNEEYDLVIDHFHGLPFFTPFFVKKPKLVFIHEVAKEVWYLNQLPRPVNWLVGFLGYIFEPYFFKYIYKNIPFMTVSRSTKEDLIRWGIDQNKIFVVNNGISTIKITINKKETNPTLVYLGALTRDKGIEDAIRIFAKVKDVSHSKNWQFWVIGKGDQGYVKKINALTHKLGLDNDIKFWGYVGEKEKFKLLAKSHFLINPSIREGWGLVVIEAATVGTPCIGYNVAGLKDSIINNKTGLLAKKNTPQDVAENVLTLMNDQSTYKNMCRDVKQWGNKFSWEISGSQSLVLIEKICETSDLL